jgi:hypothetical protein
MKIHRMVVEHKRKRKGMGSDFWIAILGLAATTLLVVVGLLNFSVFTRQLKLARDQMSTAVHQLELARKQPDLYLIQRAITEASDHARLLVERPYLRPYFYAGAEWKQGDQASGDEVLAMAEVMLNNFASALMHSAAFPEYPVRGIDRTIMFHLRNSPALRQVLFQTFDRFPFTGLSLLCFKNDSPAEVEADLTQLIGEEGLDDAESQRRRELLEILRTSEVSSPIDYAVLTMQRRR